MQFYRMKEDILPSLIIFLVFSIQLYAVVCVDSIPMLFAIAVGLLAFSASPGSISHNHHHFPTFKKQWMNRWYEVILFLETGVPPLAWTLHHNLGHHKDYLDQDKDPSGWLNRDGSVMSRVKYDLYNSLKVYPEVIRIGKQKPKLYAKFKFWTLISFTVLGLLIWWKPVASLIIFVMPMPIMLIGLLDNTYSQHSDMDISSHYTASRNTTNRFYNLVSWNLGYHTAHHLKPSLHWSKLPELHASIKEGIPDDCQCESVWLSRAPYRHTRDEGAHR